MTQRSEPPKHQGDPPQYVVRYGVMRVLGVMQAERSFQYGDKVVVQSDRGTELATVLCEATPAAMDSMVEPTQGRILRIASDQDHARQDQASHQTNDDLATCQRFVDRLKLDMELVDVERILGGEKIVVYFLAPQRVDFRQVVRELGRHFRTRIEMRQIGVRDEAKLLADYGDCGQPICCATFLSKMPPVTMKMAKIQKGTLDPTKISGRCGRLKCCLRYEFDNYESIVKEMPPVGSIVLTRDGNVVVQGQNVLANQLVVRTEDHRQILIGNDDVISVVQKASAKKANARRSGKKKKPKSVDQNVKHAESDSVSGGNDASENDPNQVN